jgi:hypothetical protein
MVGVVLLDNSVGIEIYEDGIVGLDCLVEAGSHTIGWDDLSIQDCTCWKKGSYLCWDCPLNPPSTA